MNHQTNTLSPGDLVDGFQIEQALTASAFAVTYLVSDPALGTRFVLKECFPAEIARRGEDNVVYPANDALREQLEQSKRTFQDESRLAASVQSPHVARVLRYFEANGTAYCLMAWEPGRTLEKALREQGTLPEAQLRKLFTDLLDVLTLLHEKGVRHLALSPENLYLTDRGEIVVLDFRAAALHLAGAALALQPTPYTAPESLEPDPGPEADFYSLAAVLFECATGQVPISAADRRNKVANGQPDPLPAVASHDRESTLGGLSDTIDLGLRLNPQDRPSNARAWSKHFASVDWRRQVAARPAAGQQNEGREWLTPMLLGGVLAVLVVAVLYLLFSDAPQPLDQGLEATPEAAQPIIPTEETERWQVALRADTVLGYRRFLEAFPESVYRAQAEIQLDILDERAWVTLAAEDTRAAYQDYLEQFPAGVHQTEALRRIEQIDQAAASAERERLAREQQDDADWRQARDNRTVAAMEGYLAAWPAGRHVEEATRLRRELKNQGLEERAWESARKLNNRTGYQAYLDAYPAGEHSAEALITLEYMDLSPGKAFRDCTDCPAMMVIPGGEFWQGSAEDGALAASNEKPRRVVKIPRPLAVGIHEVTFEQWDACVADGGCSQQPTDNGWGRGNRPVIMVSWNDAQEYVGWLSEKTRQEYRLPSESEWEYFARAGLEGDWLGGSPARLCTFANIAAAETGFRWQSQACSDGHALGTLPVGSLQANAFGLHDVIGNVAEWTDDCMNLTYLDAPADGSAWGRGICSSHMTRGGSWVTGERETRLAARFNLDNGDRNDFTGFRVVRAVQD